ncbi:S49 family peptidase [Spirosoma sordidisoli]|uniref:Peptidase S49 domain-containing protein n=1 Tax=Spirosoma sordidisoli TaxID=2502893 RepID=A0A4Q2UJV6_9BACT|nr:S49 family peptidase [Spirosoma sordidisoli]RYC69787.1 hypothetical protein EQG79_14425 [Spirosoma sordidisoli]
MLVVFKQAVTGLVAAVGWLARQFRGMNRSFRTISALMRHTWMIDPGYANQHIGLVNAFLGGRMASLFDDEEDDKKPIGFALAPSSASSSASSYRRVETSLSNPDLPPGSVGVIDIRGPIMKEGFCGAYGTEDYTAELNALYDNQQFIGAVILVDSGGGQLSGTPTFYDAIRNPIKPTVVLVNDGIMASAAYWLACGADWILASQPTDQIGSIGVFCRLRDYSKALEQDGIRDISVYSRRSTDKNKAFRDALAGDTTALEDELDEAVDQFEAAIRAGRGDRLKPTPKTDEPFTGKLYSAQIALSLGLIDGFGTLQAAVDKVIELAAAQPTPDSTMPSASATHSQAPALADAAASAPDKTAGDSESALTPTNPTPTDPMFGFTKLPALAAVKGLAAADVTDAHISAINAELEANGFNIASVNLTQFTQAQDLQQRLQAAEDAGRTATAEITRLTSELDKFGSQPGHLGSKSPKETEITAGGSSTNPFFSETDAEVARLKGQRA